jgi:F0F1-type ATP synthase assembly protein I
MEKNNSKGSDQLKAYAKYSTIGIQMLAIILLGVFGGIKLDDVFSLDIPIFTIVFSILSVILAIYYIIKDLLKKK